MHTITVPNPTTKSHLSAVVAEMRTLGAPTLRACWLDWERQWFAIEGSHRAVAAVALNLPITIVPVEWDDVVDDHDCDTFENESATVGEIIEALRERGRPQEINVRLA